MAENQETSKSCCSNGHGCGSKNLMVLVLVLLSGIIGYLIGSSGGHRHHGWHHGYFGKCPMGMMESPGQAPSK